MSSKAEITDSINTINDGGNNTALDVRTVFETLNSEFFPTVENVSGFTDDGVIYNFNFYKLGNMVNVNMVIETTINIIVNQDIQINLVKYYPNTIIVETIKTLLNESRIIRIGVNGLIKLNSLNPNNIYYANINYISNNE